MHESCIFFGFLKVRFEYELLAELQNEAKKYDVSIGDDVSIGHAVSIGDCVSILTRAKIKPGIKITKILHLMNAYKYHASAYYFESELYIQLGCFTRTRTEWTNDFWNNNSEFPEGSEQGLARLEAYNKICAMAEIMK